MKDKPPAPGCAWTGLPDALRYPRSSRETHDCHSLGRRRSSTQLSAGRRAVRAPATVHVLDPGPARKRLHGPQRRRSCKFWFHSRREIGQAPHAYRAVPHRPFFSGSRRLLVCADVSTVQKRHAQFHALLLHQHQQPFPSSQLRPADERLRRLPPRPKFSRYAAPLSAILAVPDNYLDCLAQILILGLVMRAARLSVHPGSYCCLA